MASRPTIEPKPRSKPAVAPDHDAAGAARRVLQQLAGAALPDWERVQPHLRELRLGAGATLFEAGQRRPCVYFIDSGVLKLVYDTPAGASWTKAFVVAEGFFASLAALQPRGLTSFAARALEPCRLQRLEFEHLRILAEQHLPWQRALARGFEIYGARKEARELELLTLNAEQRYLAFLRNHPELAERLHDREVAAYVRVTPVALSRIKGRLRRAGRLPA
jgi:CRP-like cAMP-binding protein